MSDYCVCKACGCKHLVWEKSCPYCRRIAELEAEHERLWLVLKVIANDIQAEPFSKEAATLALEGE